LAVWLLGQPVVSHPIQLTATAALSDGTTRDVTTQVAWRLDGLGAATVTADGVLTFVRDSCVGITAIYQQQIGISVVFGYSNVFTTPNDASCWTY
jgi:hypothetical protein